MLSFTALTWISGSGGIAPHIPQGAYLVQPHVVTALLWFGHCCKHVTEANHQMLVTADQVSLTRHYSVPSGRAPSWIDHTLKCIWTCRVKLFYNIRKTFGWIKYCMRASLLQALSFSLCNTNTYFVVLVIWTRTLPNDCSQNKKALKCKHLPMHSPSATPPIGCVCMCHLTPPWGQRSLWLHE